MPVENRISLKFINSKQGALDSLFKQLYDHVKESLNEMIPITTFSLIQKMLELDPSKSKIQYKRLQSITYEFMHKFNLSFKVCQTSIIEDKDLTENINKFKNDFQALIQRLNYKNDEI